LTAQVTAEGFVNRGLAKYNLGDYQGAIADYNQAIQIKPDDAVAYNNRGNAKDIL
jgi:tetratricopeptide (TPR) repeat protein